MYFARIRCSIIEKDHGLLLRVRMDILQVSFEPGRMDCMAQDDFVLLDLSAHFNNDGISYAHNRTDGCFNVWGNTFPAETLPPSLSMVEIAGVPFRFPSKEDGQRNNLSCCGQMLEVPPDIYDWLYVLGASERRSEDWLHLHFASGRVEYEWLRLSDFWPQTPARFGEVEAFRCPYMYYPRHVQLNMQPVIWRQRVAIPRQEPLVRISLPDNIAMHLFAATLSRPVSG